MVDMVGCYDEDISVDDLSGVPVKQRKRVADVLEVIEPTGILEQTRRKERIEQLAYAGLEKALTPKRVVCSKCKGSGIDKDGDDCVVCGGLGYSEKAPSERMIEMVLSPKFPKTQISVNAEIDNASREDLLRMIGEM